MRSFWALATAAVIAQAQPLHVGVKAGGVLSDFFRTGYAGSRIGGLSMTTSSVTHPATGGAFVGWDALPFGLSVELTVVYKRFNFTTAGRRGFLTRTDWGALATGRAWEPALLIKRGARWAFARPYAGAGVALRRIGSIREGSNEVVRDIFSGTAVFKRVETQSSSSFRKRWFPGVTGAGGLEFRSGRLRVGPEFRYTRWTANISSQPWPLMFEPNQFELLLSIGF